MLTSTSWCERMDIDLTGRVRSVDTKTTVNVSGKFERERKENDRIGNLLREQRDLTGFLVNEFEDQLELFEYAEQFFTEYAAK